MNKVAFITGAGGYIGGETAVTLAKQGIKIAVCDINPETIEETVKRIEKIGGTAKGYVNSVAPGVVCRPEVDTTTEGGRRYAYETNLLGEKCTAEDIANLVEFLASDKARFITGQTYVCDGGRTLSMKGSD